MAELKTWPGGEINTSPTSWSIPSAEDENWPSLTDFLSAIADSAQCTSFQKFGIRVALTSPVSISTTDCIVMCSLLLDTSVSVVLPTGQEKQVIIISDGKNNASSRNITITCQPGQNIGGSSSFVLNGDRDSVMLAFSIDTWYVVIFSHHP